MQSRCTAGLIPMIELTRPGKQTLTIDNPVMPAAGVFGFDGAAYRDLLPLDQLGALVTNPITWKPRHAARGPRVVALPAGVLIHTGLPNPGVTRAIRQYGPQWAHSPIPVIVHVVATTPADVARCAEALDRCEGVAGLELGLHDLATPADIELILQAARDVTLLPLLVRVPLYSAVESARAAQESGAGGLVVAAPPRGTTRDPESGELVGGRIYGPWLAAQTLRAVGQVARLVSIPVIGSGGIHSADDGRSFLEAGAAAIQIDSLIWTGPVQLAAIARNLAGLELTRQIGTLPDEWDQRGAMTANEPEDPWAWPPPADFLPPAPPDLPR